METKKGRTLWTSEANTKKSLGTTNLVKDGLQRPKRKPLYPVYED